METPEFQMAVLKRLDAIHEYQVSQWTDHEARLRLLERKRTVVSAVSGAVASIIVALITTLAACQHGSYVQSGTPDFAQAATVLIEMETELSAGTATGWFVAPDLVVTAGHACDEDWSIQVRTYDQEYHDAVIVYDSDEDPQDICLLRTDPVAPAVFTLAVNSDLHLGDRIWTYGYPNGFPGLFYGHFVEKRDGWIIASINGWFGSSGSAVLDDRGYVIGLLVQTRAANGTNLGLVPVEDITKAVRSML